MEAALIIALIVFFLKVTTWEGHIFENLGDWAYYNLPEKVYKPLIGCPICMTPWWGTFIYLLGDLLNIELFEDSRPLRLIFTIFAAAGINALIVMLIEIYDYFKNKNNE